MKGKTYQCDLYMTSSSSFHFIYISSMGVFLIARVGRLVYSDRYAFSLHDSPVILILLCTGSSYMTLQSQVLSYLNLILYF